MINRIIGTALFITGILVTLIVIFEIVAAKQLTALAFIGFILVSVLLIWGLLIFQKKLLKITYLESRDNLFVNTLAIIAGIFIAFILSEIIASIYLDHLFHSRYRFVEHNNVMKWARENIGTYYIDESSYTMYSPTLGWVQRPDSASRDGLYHANSAGLRSDREYPVVRQPGVLRIALFGDSFTHGTEVPIEDTWGYNLEILLNEAGIEVEVINFGVSGYGMDQAFLRWQQDGHQYSPDVVIFGFTPIDIQRNLNVFLPFLYPADELRLFKPRFVLEDDELVLVNQPTIPPEQIPQAVVDFRDSPLLEFATFYDEEIYKDYWWENSKLLSIIEETYQRFHSRLTRYNSTDRNFLELSGETAQLTVAIMEAFRDSVEAQGAKFLIVHLPSLTELRYLTLDQPLSYGDLLRYLDEDFETIHTEDSFLDTESGLDSNFLVLHYSAQGNNIVARIVADHILSSLGTSEMETQDP